MLTVVELDAIDDEVKTLIDAAVDEAKAAEIPNIDQLTTDVYANYSL